MRIFSYLLIIIVIFFGITFAAINANPVTFNYFLGVTKLPLALLLVLAFAIGSIIGMIAASWLVFRMKITNYRLHQRLVLAEKEIENLRAIPLQDNV